MKTHSCSLKIKDAAGNIIAEKNSQSNADGTYVLEMPDDIKSWDEFSPVIYYLEAKLDSGGNVLQTQTSSFGFREVKTEGKSLLINGEPFIPARNS
jgi:beta-galactosidase/beta-glucuronidase